MKGNNKSFGDYLKKLRINRRESLADVSGAVEIDVMVLDHIESGNIKPTEDVLMLLISYYCLREDEALRLWKLGGYEDNQKFLSDYALSSLGQSNNNTESPILYTDSTQVIANQYGVVIEFLQGLGPDGKPKSVSRFGMSREHAKTIIEVLKKSLELSNEQSPYS